MLQDISNLRQKRAIDYSKYKTEMCRNWLENQSCHYGNKCNFAHGDSEIIEKAPANYKYKSKKCMPFHTLGYCTYGHRCLFLHEIKATNDIDLDRVDQLLGKTKRLKVFERIAPSDSRIEEYLHKVSEGSYQIDWEFKPEDKS